MGSGPWWITFGRALLIAAIAALFLAYAGAFGSIGAPLGARLGYWLSTMIGASLIGTCVFAVGAAQGVLDKRPFLGVGLLSLIMAMPLTVLVWFMTTRFFPDQRAIAPLLLPAYFPPVLLISAIMTAINYLASSRAPRLQETHAAQAGAPPPKFLARIPLKLRGGELYAVQAEDHYLRIHTSKGSDLILLRLADAIAELEGIEGAQTHRSWWVAQAAVTNAKRADGRAVLTLKNGVEAPVSRRHAAALRDGGWF
jgi:DNA-binding LytR/AlgR family response regulator